MQAAMQELFLQQKEKGGIIDLEAEEKKYLVVTNSGTSQDEALAELSPTDYQPGKISSLYYKNATSAELRPKLILKPSAI